MHTGLESPAALLFVTSLAVLIAGCDTDGGDDGDAGTSAAATDADDGDGADGGDDGGSSTYFIHAQGEMPGGAFDFECDLENDPEPSDQPNDWWQAGNPHFEVNGTLGLFITCCEVTPESTDAATLRCLRGVIGVPDGAGQYSNGPDVCMMAASGFFVLGTTSTPGTCDQGWTVQSETADITAVDQPAGTAAGSFSGSYVAGDGAAYSVSGSFNGLDSDLLGGG